MISRIASFYGEQIRVLWEWRGGRVALLKRLLITLIVATVSFAATAGIMGSRFTVDRLLDAVVAVILIALFNAIVRPVVLALAAPISLILVGVLVLIFQVVAFLVVANYAPGVHVDGFLVALVASIIYAIINTVLTAILGIDSGGSYYGLLVQRLLVKRSTGHSDKPGLVIIQIDGLAHPILAGRMRAGSVNTMAGLVRDGSHKLSRWEAILPSMTSGSQAGILHGNNDGIPAFRWYERDRGHLMASSNPVDAMLIGSRITNGEGLLSNNGASICNLLTGDATRSYLTTAAIKAEGGGVGDSQAFLSFFFSPSGYMRSFTLFLGEFIKELTQARRTRRSGIKPQMHRGLKYAGMRAASNVLLRDVNTSLIIDEMYRGTNVIYADFTDYDELAHHCGPERVESFEALDGVDGAIATIIKATDDAPRPYKFIVLSDHGQSLGETFLQRYGVSLGEYIRQLMGGRATIVQSKTKAEGSTFVNALLSEITTSKGVGPTVARAALASKTDADGTVNLDDVEEEPAIADATTIAVVGSGNLGLVWFTGHDHRLTVEELEALHPGLVASVAAHPGVGLLLIRSKEFGAVVFGPNGTRFLDQDRVEGEDPTTLFGPHTIMSLKREDAMVHAPDLLLLSQYDPVLGEVAAFEELIGSHGGLGGPQTEPFILHPAEWQLDEEVPLGAPAIYRNIRRWLESIGIELGKPKATTPAGATTTQTPDERTPEPAPVA
jgi:uncharacterized membrane protein YvlD (DUF360 family)